MTWIYRNVIRPILFEQNSEAAHEWMLASLSWANRSPVLGDAIASLFESPNLPVDLFELSFPNPVGLAAGMDKHATALPAWEGLGFGFAELGGVTWHSQEGNPQPRLFRAVDSEALINRMGFNNPGARKFAANLTEWESRGRWPNHPIAINLGKSKTTPLEQAPEDYAQSLHALWKYADFFVVNVSSPNTPNLRELQNPSALDEVLAAVQEANQQEASARAKRTKEQIVKNNKVSLRDSSHPKPILVKIAPDLPFEALDELLKITFKREIAGIVATNTTVTRPASNNADLQRVYGEEGGLSGRPLRERSTEVIRHLYRSSCGRLPIIGVGGVFNASDAWEKITAGASLVQVYTSLVYEGPGIAKKIVQGLRGLLTENGFKNLKEAVGTSSV